MEAEDGASANAPLSRLLSVLEVAALHETTVPLDELTSILPDSAPSTPSALREWLLEHPQLVRVAGDRVGPANSSWPSGSVLESRRSRGDVYLRAGTELAIGPFADLGSMLRCLAITGSAAYREPKEGDDVDLMAITAPGTIWVFLTLAFLRLRFLGARLAPGGARWCLNYVIDERTARADFARPQGFQFAREALTTRTLLGVGFYQSLLRSAPWMIGELPRLYRQSLAGPEPGLGARPRVGWLVRSLNALLYPFVATYLQVAGLYRNYRFRRSHRSDDQFRTVTELGRFSLESEKFDRLGAVYARTPARRPSGVAE